MQKTGLTLLLTSLLLLATTIVLPAGAAQSPAGIAGGGLTGPASRSADAAAASAALRLAPAGTDWKHTLQVVSWLKANPPKKPLVLMFGSSIVRESVTSDASWAAAVKSRRGGAVLTYDLGSTNQSFAQNLALVPNLPQVPTLVFIGVDVARFVAAPGTATVKLPAPQAPSASYDPHRYSSSRIKTLAQKRALVKDWLARRYPVFKKNYSYNLGVLKKLVQACKDRGLHPVLLDTPRNTAVIKGAWKKAIDTYTAGVRTLARQMGVPFVTMVASARFANADFYDLLHAVQPGRAKWQKLLAAQTVALLKHYGLR
jgi:hypothetical protein